VVKEKCTDCYGSGYIASKKKIQVSIPAGIDNGQSVRIREKGEPGLNGGPRGDLLVEVLVSRHPVFERQDYTVYSEVPITFPQAALGADIRIKTIDGEVIYTVKSGTKSGTKVRLRGKGIPTLRNKSVRGDHIVTLIVQVPDHLTSEQKEALKAFDDAMGGSLKPTKVDDAKVEKEKDGKKKKKGMFDKIKDALD
jgi:molecular chaperone DnaJ